MSMPSSPRVPVSPDTARRRTPRTKDKRRALRDFYGLQQNQSTGPVVHDPILDGPDFSVNQYLEVLNEKNDVKGLLKLENTMIRDIRVLDGERKALIYDNYDKMISATVTIKKMTTELGPMGRESFDPLLKSITELTTEFNVVDIPDVATAETPQLISQDLDEAMKLWVKNGPSRVTQLLENGCTVAAQQELEDVEQTLNILEEVECADVSAELAHLKQKFEVEAELAPNMTALQESPLLSN